MLTDPKSSMDSCLRRERRAYWTNMQNTLGYTNIPGLGGGMTSESLYLEGDIDNLFTW